MLIPFDASCSVLRTTAWWLSIHLLSIVNSLFTGCPYDLFELCCVTSGFKSTKLFFLFKFISWHTSWMTYPMSLILQIKIVNKAVKAVVYQLMVELHILHNIKVRTYFFRSSLTLLIKFIGENHFEHSNKLSDTSLKHFASHTDMDLHNLLHFWNPVRFHRLLGARRRKLSSLVRFLAAIAEKECLSVLGWLRAIIYEKFALFISRPSNILNFRRFWCN